MEVVRNHSYEPVAMVLAVRHHAGDKAATKTGDSVTTVAGSATTAAGGRVLHARRGAVAAPAAVAGELLPRGSCNCKVEASVVHGPGHQGDGSGGGGAGVLVMRRHAASRLLPYYSVSRVVVV
ncbi:hypothetical protein BDA96_05G104500 [Sorghum bicolor]|uniref:Uncharacterized protein n=2 Tax=Sorghum bicolor TaxID=4558 RepID=A0A921QW67_SORBI|nr:hypothetical protein BDA96_05G104500 [Sorghum bicolor]KXG28236.1 hypothetical protein SORBI_3005G101000 [Sorghum bicolor]